MSFAPSHSPESPAIPSVIPPAIPSAILEERQLVLLGITLGAYGLGTPIRSPLPGYQEYGLEQAGP